MALLGELADPKLYEVGRGIKRTSVLVKRPSKGSTLQTTSAPRQPWKQENKKVEVAMVEELKKTTEGKKRERSGIPPPFFVSVDELYSNLEA